MRGVVRVLGKPVQGRKPHTIARAGIGFVPEDGQVFPEHCVEDNLIIAAKKGPDGQDYWNLTRVYEMFPMLVHLRERMAGRLSGGEQQMPPSPARSWAIRPGCCWTSRVKGWRR